MAYMAICWGLLPELLSVALLVFDFRFILFHYFEKNCCLNLQLVPVSAHYGSSVPYIAVQLPMQKESTGLLADSHTLPGATELPAIVIG